MHVNWMNMINPSVFWPPQELNYQNPLFKFFSMEGGELFNRIQERADSAFTERGMYISAGLCHQKIFTVNREIIAPVLFTPILPSSGGNLRLGKFKTVFEIAVLTKKIIYFKLCH